MADILTIPQILNIAKISQYLAAQYEANKTFLKGGVLDMTLSRKIYMERRAIQYIYNLNVNDPFLRETANYLYALCGRFAIQAQNILNPVSTCISPTITIQPISQSIMQGSAVTFSVTATGTSLQYQWKKNGIDITGAIGTTYMISNVQYSDGGVYSCVISNGCGIATSNNATLTVTAGLQGSYFYGDIDYYNDLINGIDDIPYNGTFSITNSQPLVVNFTSGAQNNKFNGIRYPISQGIKTTWFNTISNNGTIPDQVYRAVITIGSYLYIISRDAMSLDSTTQTVTFS